MAAEKLRPDPLVAFYCVEITFPTLSVVNSGPVRIFYESFLREIHFPMTVPNKVCPTLSWLIFDLYDAHSDLCT